MGHVCLSFNLSHFIVTASFESAASSFLWWEVLVLSRLMPDQLERHNLRVLSLPVMAALERKRENGWTWSINSIAAVGVDRRHGRQSLMDSE